jgi:subtilase family serine protease
LVTRTAPSAGLTTASECAIDYPSACLSPQQLRDAYFPEEAPEAPAGEPQTIALVDAYNDPSAESDLATYSGEFALPSCTSANGCFKQVGESGGEGSPGLPFPRTKAELDTFANGTTAQRETAEEAEGWALEIATDIETAHAICRNCHILFVAAKSPSYSDLEAAEETAAARAGEVSNSWGGPETGLDSQAFDHPGIVITAAAAGDDGYLNWEQYSSRGEAGSPYFLGTDYPAGSPHVIAVGGTRLQLSADGAWQSETPWSSEGAGGSGCSESLVAPEWQWRLSDWAQVGCGSLRASADVSAVADPTTGVNVYDSIPYPYEEAGEKLTTVPHWVPIGGTSVASPIIASMFALAGGAHGVDYPAKTLYSHIASPLLHDVDSRGNGECQGEYLSCSGSLNPLSARFPLDCGAAAWICNATTGYDGPTGVGTPNGIGAFRVEQASGEKDSSPAKGVGGSETRAGAESTDSGNSSGGGSGSAAGAGGTTNTSDGGAAKPHTSSSASPRLTRLALTARGTAALRRHRQGKSVAIAQVAFSFALSRAAQIRATLLRRVSTRAGVRWIAVTHALGFSTNAGAHRRALHGSQLLAPGLYRLTLSPLGGTARSITVRVL